MQLLFLIVVENQFKHEFSLCDSSFGCIFFEIFILDYGITLYIIEDYVHFLNKTTDQIIAYKINTSNWLIVCGPKGQVESF